MPPRASELCVLWIQNTLYKTPPCSLQLPPLFLYHKSYAIRQSLHLHLAGYAPTGLSHHKLEADDVA